MHPFYENKQEDFLCFLSIDMNFPHHLHQVAELLFVEEGSLEVTINEETRLLETGSVALIFPDTIHHYRTPESSKIHLCIFSSGCAKDYYHLLRKYVPKKPFLKENQVHEDISLGFQRMIEYQDTDTAISKAWLHLILAHILPRLELALRLDTDKTDVTYKVVRYISEHFQEPITLEGIAKELHFNKNYVSRVFSGKLGCGFYHYVNKIRLDYAAGLIRMSDSSLTEIWQDAGFESQRTFNRVFRDAYGMTPMAYRKGW